MNRFIVRKGVVWYLDLEWREGFITAHVIGRIVALIIIIWVTLVNWILP